MKNVKKLIVMLLAVIMTLSMAIPAFSANATGTITITNATAGKSYSAYKVFDATLDGKGNIAYTYSGTLPANDYFAQDSVGNVTAKAAAKDSLGNLTSGAVAFLETIKGSAVKTIVADSDTVVFSGLDYGYYYIQTTNGSAITVDSTNPDAVVIDKNQKTGFDKKIIVGYEQDGTPILDVINTVNVGEKVEYYIRIDATNYNGAKYITNYYVYDKLDEALTFNDDISVTVNGTVLSQNAYEIASGEDAGDFAFKINIPWVDGEGKFLYNKTMSTIVVRYSATVNENVKTAAPMKNEATYNFKDTITPPDRPEEVFIDPNPDIPYRETFSYSTKVKISKVDADDNALTGAKFKIYGESYTISVISETVFEEVGENGTHYMLKNGKYTTDDPVLEDKVVDGVTVKANINLYDSAEKKYALVEHITKDTVKKDIVSEGWVDEDGYITFTGLGEGDYLIKELVAPDGYNLLQNPIAMSVVFDLDNKVFSAEYKEEGSAADAVEVTAEDGVINIKVVNNKGTELPATGGNGTVWFIVIGAVLFLGMGVVLVTKKRMYNAGK